MTIYLSYSLIITYIILNVNFTLDIIFQKHPRYHRNYRSPLDNMFIKFWQRRVRKLQDADE